MTLLSLVYIHMQMQTIHMAYRGKQKQKEIHQVIESNGNLQYAILNLKSSSHLGGALLTEKSKMQFADASHIVQVSFYPEASREETALPRQANSLLNLLSFATEAEAKGQQ